MSAPARLLALRVQGFKSFAERTTVEFGPGISAVVYFQFFVEQDRLNMFVVQRSGDMFLGVPYDVALFAKVLLYIAEKTNLKANYIDVQIVGCACL